MPLPLPVRTNPAAAALPYELHEAECLAWLAQEPAGKYDLILADPPYRTTGLDFDRRPALDWPAWWREAWRVVKPGGVIILFAADLFTVDLIAGQRANYRYRLVWDKTMATGFLAAKRRPLRAHEDIVIFGRQAAASTYHPQKVPRAKGSPSKSNHSRRGNPAHYGTCRQQAYVDDGQRYPTSVLSFASVPTVGRLHPTQKPVDLLRYLLRTYSNPGDQVLDCFAGAGSTLEACLLEKRCGVGVEEKPLYVSRARKRLQKVLARPELDFTAAARPISAGRQRQHKLAFSTDETSLAGSSVAAKARMPARQAPPAS